MKFFNLLKKELRELVNKQMLIGMVVSLVILFSIGNIMGNVMEDAMNPSDITICDRDNTEFTKEIISELEKNGDKIIQVEVTDGSYSEMMNKLGKDSLIVIPEGFTDDILVNKKPAKLETVSVMKGTSMSGTLNGSKTSDITDKIEEAVKDRLMLESYKLSESDVTIIKEPVEIKGITVVKDKYVEASSAIVASFSMAQGIVVPIVIFILVMFASQMIMSAISTEKIDKTLETLLSAPVSRLSVLAAKMLAATIVAVLNAVVYMFGFSSYMGSMMGGAVNGAVSSAGGDAAAQALGAASALQQLGLVMSPVQYVLLGLQMFMTIMIALSISLMLGSMATDVKSSQTLIMPIMFSAMIPYMISMFTSINELSLAPRIIMYLIPFTHTFTATDNLLFGNMTLYWGGLIYQALFLAVCMFLAVRLFTSDKLFTMSLNFGKRKKSKEVTE
ncbi:MAG TPA: ABC transporter permease [Oscillospiraceae bacterium]|nr:ABC transporter permease [Oscillospiraceae bacterium]